MRACLDGLGARFRFGVAAAARVACDADAPGGLFLAACSAQTWSGFSSIMMDDPVTHFDDLNTYALLDINHGLQSSSDGERQIVISTCDEKLLQLARHKFRHLGSAAKFYRFQAIGTEGPMVSEIPA